MYTMFLLAMSAARRSIQNLYFLPDDRMTQVLTEAPRRGMRMVVLLPGAIDNSIVRQASRSHFGTLLEAGVEIYECRAGLLHAKTMTVDGIGATVGSTNLDTRSFALNEELNTTRGRSTTRGGRAEGSSTDCRSSSPFLFATRCRGASRGPATARRTREVSPRYRMRTSRNEPRTPNDCNSQMTTTMTTTTLMIVLIFESIGT